MQEQAPSADPAGNVQRERQSVPLRVLVVEDSPQDASLVLRELRKAGYNPEHTRVETDEEMKAALDKDAWDLILCDYMMPGFSGLAALELTRRKDIDIPFIVVSGQIGEDVAVEAMKAGAHDYVMKAMLKRLGPAVKRELADAENRRRRREAEQALRDSEAELRALANRLLQLQEEERRAVARELHDEMGQQLTVLKILTEKLRRSMGPAATAEISEISRVVSDLVAQMRSLSLRLRPGMLDDLGLLPTLEWHFQDFARRTSLVVDFKHFGLERNLPPDVLTAAYRIIQEALTNVLRHARIDRVAVSAVADGDKLRIEIRDEGAGFEPKAVSMSTGIRGMRERATSLGGTLTIESAPGKGTLLKVELPLTQPE